MNKEILTNRFKSLVQELNKLDSVLKNSSTTMMEKENELKEIYLRDDSSFDEVVSKLHSDSLDKQTMIQVATTQSTITSGRVLECYNLMTLLGIEPDFEKPEDKLNILNLKSSLELDFSFEGDNIVFEDSEFIQEMKKYKDMYIQKAKENFETDKKYLKDAQ